MRQPINAFARLIVTVALCAGASVAAAPTAEAQAGDVVSGSGLFDPSYTGMCRPGDTGQFSLDAVGSGYDGGGHPATGSFSFSCVGDGVETLTFSGYVTCLQVWNYSEIPHYARGHIAKLGGVVTASNTPFPVGDVAEFLVSDGAPAGLVDRIGYVGDGGPDYVPCSRGLEESTYMPVTDGDIAITDGYVPPPPPECRDGLDNDGDSRIDLADPGCQNSNDPTESPDPPACYDNLDNDHDGYTDWPSDPGCSAPSDDDEYNVPVPSVTVSVAPASVAEGTRPLPRGKFTALPFKVTLSAKQTTATTVTLHLEPGTASAGADYRAKTQTITIPAGKRSKVFSVKVVPDQLVEGDESFVAVIEASSVPTAAGFADGTILDDD